MEGVAGHRGPGTKAAWAWWTLAAAALLAFRVAANGGVPSIAHDSFQYLAVAGEAMDGRIGQTSLVHFDAERSFDTVPAPMVTFPSGYPLLVALLGATGLSLGYAALAVNLACALACVPLLWWMTGKMAQPVGVRHAVLALGVTNGSLMLFASTASTEMLFTALLLCGAAMLLRAHTSDGPAYGAWLGAGLAFGAAYHVRYAGIFLVLALGVVAARHLIAGRRAPFTGYVLTGATASAAVLAGIARNVMLVGNWRGGNEKEVSNALGDVVVQTGRAINGIVLGPPSGPADGSLVPRALFALALVTVAALGVLKIWRRRHHGRDPAIPFSARWFTIDLLLLVAVYCAFMFYAGLTTVISYGTRMFVPLVPPLALLAGAGVSVLLGDGVAPTGRLRAALVAALAGYALFNLASLRAPGVDRATTVLGQLSATTESGGTLREEIEQLAPHGRVIVANNGQALGYLLGRSTISLVGPHYSQAVWTDQMVREVVENYDAAVVIVTAPNPLQPPDSDLIPSPFIAALARGAAPPWLRLASRAGPVSVYTPVAAIDSPAARDRD